MEKKLEIGYLHVDSLDFLAADDRALVAEAQKAVGKAYAEYSKFRVGAAARLRSGAVLHGANSESEVFPSGICAERSLLYYSDPSERECYPCGGCRQVILDVQRRQGTPIRIIMSGGGTASVVDNAEALLPFTFRL